MRFNPIQSPNPITQILPTSPYTEKKEQMTQVSTDVIKTEEVEIVSNPDGEFIKTIGDLVFSPMLDKLREWGGKRKDTDDFFRQKVHCESAKEIFTFLKLSNWDLSSYTNKTIRSFLHGQFINCVITHHNKTPLASSQKEEIFSISALLSQNIIKQEGAKSLSEKI